MKKPGEMEITVNVGSDYFTFKINFLEMFDRFVMEPLLAEIKKEEKYKNV